MFPRGPTRPTRPHRVDASSTLPSDGARDDSPPETPRVSEAFSLAAPSNKRVEQTADGARGAGAAGLLSLGCRSKRRGCSPAPLGRSAGWMGRAES